jgi:hypothetical protein
LRCIYTIQTLAFQKTQHSSRVGNNSGKCCWELQKSPVLTLRLQRTSSLPSSHSIRFSAFCSPRVTFLKCSCVTCRSADAGDQALHESVRRVPRHRGCAVHEIGTNG